MAVPITKSARTVETPEGAIVRSELALAQAVRSHDADASACLIGEQFFAVLATAGAALETVTRPVWLNLVRRGALDSFVAHDIRVRVHKGVGVATMICADRQKSSGSIRLADLLVTDIWLSRAGGWTIAERHVARVASLQR